MPEIATSPVLFALVALAGYLMGSVPFGILMARAFGLGDLRKVGSGNIGATNVLRTGNRTAAALTLGLDAAKGAAAVLIARAAGLAEDAAALAGLAAFLGHLFPVWIGFRGGKGVATFLGTLLALAPLAGVAACATWLVTAAVFRISSLSALVAAALAPLYMLALGEGGALAAALMAALVYVRHGANIARLRAGTEPRIGAKGAK
ncbi:MAG: glycerol-3-phosphate 1-O-acyltransferase PlsY [Gemmobacter sp.]